MVESRSKVTEEQVHKLETQLQSYMSETNLKFDQTNTRLDETNGKLDELSSKIEILLDKFLSSSGNATNHPSHVQNGILGPDPIQKILLDYPNVFEEPKSLPPKREHDHFIPRLDLPAGSQIHSVFHVSQLKKWVGPKITVQPQPPACDEDGNVLIRPLAILQRRMMKVNNAVGVKVLIQWANMGADEATWEDWGYI